MHIIFIHLELAIWMFSCQYSAQSGYQTINIGKAFNGKSDKNDTTAWDEEYHFGPTELGRQGTGRNMSKDRLGEQNW